MISKSSAREARGRSISRGKPSRAYLRSRPLNHPSGKSYSSHHASLTGLPMRSPFAELLASIGPTLRARGAALDLELVRGTLSLLEQALDQSDLMPVLDRALERVGLAGR